MELNELGPGLGAEFGVEIGEWLIHEEHLGTPHDRPGQRHTLALTARQLSRLAVEVGIETENRRCLGDPPVDLGTLDPA